MNRKWKDLFKKAVAVCMALQLCVVGVSAAFDHASNSNIVDTLTGHKGTVVEFEAVNDTTFKLTYEAYGLTWNGGQVAFTYDTTKMAPAHKNGTVYTTATQNQFARGLETYQHPKNGFPTDIFDQYDGWAMFLPNMTLDLDSAYVLMGCSAGGLIAANGPDFGLVENALTLEHTKDGFKFFSFYFKTVGDTKVTDIYATDFDLLPGKPNASNPTGVQTMDGGVNSSKIYFRNFPTAPQPVKGTLSIIGEAQMGQTLIASVQNGWTEARYTYEWYANDTLIPGKTQAALNLDELSLLGKTIQVKATIQAPYFGTLASAATTAVTKGTQIRPAAPTVQEARDVQITLKEVPGCEYSKGGGAWQSSPVFSGLTPVTSYSFQQRYVATSMLDASPASDAATIFTSMTIPAAPTGLTGQNPTSAVATDGKISGLDATLLYEYKLATAADYTSLPEATTAIENLGVGQYLIRLPATSTTAASDATTIALTFTPAGGGDGGGGGGGSSTPTLQPPKITHNEGGQITINKNNDISIMPDAGYRIQDVVLNGQSQGAVTSLAALKNTDEVVVTFEKADTMSTHFVDVSGHWAEEAIAYCVDRNLFNGMTPTEFRPQVAMSRSMLVTALHRFAGTPTVEQSASFTDTADNAWYADAVAWASALEIVNGVGADRFAPDAPVTREQIAVILYNYAKTMAYDLSGAAELGQFHDAQTSSVWAHEALLWAVQNGLLQGKTDNRLDPTGNATRAEVATMLMRFAALK